jgi:hypothetical protein
MKTVQLITDVQEFLANRVYVKTAMRVRPNGKVHLILTDKKRGQTIIASVQTVIKADTEHGNDYPF